MMPEPLPTVMLLTTIVLIGLIGLLFGKKIAKQVNPFYDSPFQTVITCKNSRGYTIYIFRWRPGAKRDHNLEKVMKDCGITFISEDDLRGQVHNPNLPKSYSISIITPQRKFLTLDVENVLPHMISPSLDLPNSSVDYYAGIRECHVLDISNMEHSGSVLGIPVEATK